jgi:hypothetical protein
MMLFNPKATHLEEQSRGVPSWMVRPGMLTPLAPLISVTTPWAEAQAAMAATKAICCEKYIFEYEDCGDEINSGYGIRIELSKRRREASSTRLMSCIREAVGLECWMMMIDLIGVTTSSLIPHDALPTTLHDSYLHPLISQRYSPWHGDTCSSPSRNIEISMGINHDVLQAASFQGQSKAWLREGVSLHARSD